MTSTFELPWERWPEADRALWDALVAQGGPLDDAGALSHLRPATLSTLRHNYARWLAWLRASQPEVLAEPPERRATAERLSAWMDSLAHLAPASRLTFLDAPVRVLSRAAPDLDWEAQRRLQGAVRRAAARSPGSRKLGRIKSSAVLLDAGLALAGPRADAAGTALEASKRRRDGTMIAVLALLPMRRRAFATLELGSSVLVAEDRIDIVLSGEMTKNGVPWEASVPEVIAPLLRRYVDEVRPYLLSRGDARHDLLWTDGKGRPLQPDYLTRRIGRAAEKLTGARVSPHLFRDAAATTLARLSPKAARLIRPLLGHASFGVAERCYNHATTIEAGRDYATLVARLRGEA